MDLSSLGNDVGLSKSLRARMRGPRLLDEEGDESGANALMLPGKSKKSKRATKPPTAARAVLAASRPEARGPARAATAAAAGPASRLEKRKSKSQLKKLAKLEENRVKREKRAHILQELRESAMSENQMQLLRRSGALGQRDTLKQRLQRAVRSERMGLAVDEADAERLMVPLEAARGGVRDPSAPVQPAPEPPQAAEAAAIDSEEAAASASPAPASATPAPSAPRAMPSVAAPAAPAFGSADGFSFSVGVPAEGAASGGWAGAASAGSWSTAVADPAAPRATTDGSGQPLIPQNRAVKGVSGLTERSAAHDALEELRRRNAELMKQGQVAASARTEIGALEVNPNKIKKASVALDGQAKPKRHTMSLADKVRAQVYEEGSHSGGAARVQRLIDAALGNSVLPETYDDEESDKDAEAGGDGDGADQESDGDGGSDDGSGDEDDDDDDDDSDDESGSDDDSEPPEPHEFSSMPAPPGGIRDERLPTATAVAMMGSDAAAATVAGGLSAESAMASVKRSVPLKLRSGAVAVTRRPEIIESRSKLPVVGMEQEVMEAIDSHGTVILCGETGSGKTTQVPQFLYEAGYGAPASEGGKPGLIAVTQPRRVAALTTAARVADELGVKCGSNQTVVSIVRYEASRIGPRTRLAFMTDGVLLREAQEDLLLRRFSAIVLDEAHERNLNTDVLIGLLSRALPLRNRIAEEHDAAAAKFSKRNGGKQPADDAAVFRGPHGSGRVRALKLVIMSATLRVEDFTANKALFRIPPPVVNVPARQFPVTTHFAKRTEMLSYVDAAVRKVVSIHEKLPEGGVLVFLTGQGEIDEAVSKLKSRFGAARRRVAEMRRREEEEAAAILRSGDAAADTAGSGDTGSGSESGSDSSDDEDDSDDDGDDGEQGEGDKRKETKDADAEKQAGPKTPEYPRTLVLPLYAMLPQDEQLRAYVVDCGRVKRRTWDLRAGTSRFEVGWISQASADQRAGRAGRTGPGHTYRLYSAAVFQERFSRFEPPETETMPLDAMVLQLKKMGIRSVQSFPFPSPPPKHALIAAVRQLSALGILQLSKGHAASMGPGAAEASSGPAARDEEALTALGDRVADLPVAPSLAKMLVLAASGGPDLLAWVTAVVAIMTADTPFIYPKRRRPQDIKAAARARAAGGAEAEAVRQLDGDEDGDADDDGDADADPLELAAMTATSAAEEAELAERRKEAEECRIAHGRIRHTSSDALTALRLVGAHAHSCIDASTDEERILQVVTAGLLHRVARRATAEEAEAILPQHGLSLHTGDDIGDMPEMIVAQEVLQSSGVTKRHLLRGCSEVDEEWLADLSAGTPMVVLGRALPVPQPDYDPDLDGVKAWHEPQFGDGKWRLSPVPRPVANTDMATRCFARALLSGRVLGFAKQLAPFLVAPADLVVKGGGQRRIQALLSVLAAPPGGAAPVSSRAALAKVWAGNPAFLLPELSLWYPAEQAAALVKTWPAIVSSEVPLASASDTAAAAASAAAAGGLARQAGPAAAAAASSGAGPSSSEAASGKRKPRRKRARSPGAGKAATGAAKASKNPRRAGSASK
ncbi:hypothetical protein FNF28_00218 [Cafeteria roenbergensis]|uniref:RNA helicase n=1 Tax=Cafeteria roenbergensis TaxID=33653 RepID=A0A5A8E336_CAFRO|nr:hypothetical protein FNF28_00218 [Cafeteria roenbergensis]